MNNFSEVNASIRLRNVEVGRYCHVSRAILDTGVVLPEGSVIGENPERDRAAGHYVTEGGITVVSVTK